MLRPPFVSVSMPIKLYFFALHMDSNTVITHQVHGVAVMGMQTQPFLFLGSDQCPLK